ncbi:MAG: hypothetical protein JSU67_14425 [Gammaproteobacteria bacterium]|nr:MAG: hypothetical protein JSU67_14425 [Gammaproteobacteria bacterium]
MNATSLSGHDSPRITANKEIEIQVNFIRSIGSLGLLLLTSYSFATENAPSAPEASPEVYKVLAENDQFRVIEAIWQPGQEDNFHSHPSDRVSLYQTNCNLLLTNPDGTNREGKPKAGTAKARTGKPVISHKVKNLGDHVCIIRIVELK